MKELTHRFGNPELISKLLINKLLELPALKDNNISSLRTYVDDLHNIVRTLKSYDHGADLKAAANMQLVIKRLQPRIKPVETHYKNTYFFALTLTKMLTVAN